MNEKGRPGFNDNEKSIIKELGFDPWEGLHNLPPERPAYEPAPVADYVAEDRKIDADMRRGIWVGIAGAMIGIVVLAALLYVYIGG